MFSVSAPFPIFTDVDGDPLDDGYIYVGTAGLFAQTNQIQAYWDSGLTIPAAQPIRTINGYPSRSGSAARIYVAEDDCSTLVLNKNQSLVFSELNAGDLTSASRVSGSPAYATKAALAAAVLPSGVTVKTKGYYDGWAAFAEPQGSGEYEIALLSEVRTAKNDVAWSPDGFVNFFIANAGGTTHVAMLKFDDVLLARQAGAKGDGSTDDTAALAAALEVIRSDVGLATDYLENKQCVLQLGPGIFRTTSALTVGAVRIHGVGHEMRYSNEDTINTVGAGSYLYFDHIGKGIIFASEAVPVGNPQRSGSELVNFATIRNQPTPAPAWTPDLTLDWDIYSNDRHSIKFLDFAMKNPTKGIYMNKAERSTFTRVTGQPLLMGIQIEGTFDVVRFNSIHFWPFWSLNTNVQAYTVANAVALKLGRVDGPFFGDIFTLRYRSGLELVTDVDGNVTRMHANNLYFDGGSQGVVIDAAVTDLIARIDSMYCFADVTTAVQGRSLLAQGDNCEISIGHLESKWQQKSVVEATGTGNVISIAHLNAKEWNQANDGSQALKLAAGNVINVEDVMRGATSSGTPGFIGAFGKYNVSLGRGRVDDTTDISGDLTITHNLPVTPTSIVVSIHGTTAYRVTPHTLGATTFKVRVTDSAGAAVTSTAVTVSWDAGIAN